VWFNATYDTFEGGVQKTTISSQYTSSFSSSSNLSIFFKSLHLIDLRNKTLFHLTDIGRYTKPQFQQNLHHFAIFQPHNCYTLYYVNMKDVGVAVDRRTHSNDSITYNLERRNPTLSPSVGSNIIELDSRGTGRGIRSLPTGNSGTMTSDADHEVQELVERLSLEEQVSAIDSIPL
jgi:hypothetical protein